jgi:hypothetical protein
MSVREWSKNYEVTEITVTVHYNASVSPVMQSRPRIGEGRYRPGAGGNQKFHSVNFTT